MSDTAYIRILSSGWTTLGGMFDVRDSIFKSSVFYILSILQTSVHFLLLFSRDVYLQNP